MFLDSAGSSTTAYDSVVLEMTMRNSVSLYYAMLNKPLYVCHCVLRGRCPLKMPLPQRTLRYTKERCDEIRRHVVIPSFMRISFGKASTTRILVSANKGRFGTSSTISLESSNAVIEFFGSLRNACSAFCLASCNSRGSIAAILDSNSDSVTCTSPTLSMTRRKSSLRTRTLSFLMSSRGLGCEILARGPGAQGGPLA